MLFDEKNYTKNETRSFADRLRDDSEMYLGGGHHDHGGGGLPDLPQPLPPPPLPPRPEPPFPQPPRPPRPHPGPDNPRPHPPHPPAPEQGGFPPGLPFQPPQGSHWGWQDPGRFARGWDSWFFLQDPNHDKWQDPLSYATANVLLRLDLGDSQGAADELSMDLYQIKGDRYAQDELLNQIYSADRKGTGADLQLKNWDPDRGTWDDIQVVPDDGSQSIQINAYDYDDSPPWD